MRIGILTFHRSINYGAFMQCYALSKRLMEDFPEDVFEVIDYHMPKVAKRYSTGISQYLKESSPIVLLKKVILLPIELNRINIECKRNTVFKNALASLPLSKDMIFDDGVEAVFDLINKNYDILIVGSDAVWNYIVREFPNAYYPDERVKCHKLSYAASCYGMEFLNRCEREKPRIGEILSSFDFLGVRDTVTKNFVEWSGCDKIPIHTCDPTALLEINALPIKVEILKQKLANNGFSFTKPTIGVMGNEKMARMVRKLYGNRYQIASLYNFSREADVQLLDLNPFEWAYVFRLFRITFTTFFHGTMLSLRNGIPVVCIALETEFSKYHTPKTLDVLTRLGYEDWYFETDYVSLNVSDIKAKADTLLELSLKDEICTKLEKEAESYNMFKNALDNVRMKS